MAQGDQHTTEGAYKETVGQIADECSASFYEAYPPIEDIPQEALEVYGFSASPYNGREVTLFVNRVLNSPEEHLSSHSEKHIRELPQVFTELRKSFRSGDLIFENVSRRWDIRNHDNSFAEVPRYKLTTAKEKNRTISKYLPVQYANELSFYNVDSRNKAKHIRRLLSFDPGMGFMTGLSLLKMSDYTDTPQFLREDLFEVLDETEFIRTNNYDHRNLLKSLIENYYNPHSVLLYEETLQEASSFFPELKTSFLAKEKGEFIDRFKPLIIFSSSVEHLQGYLETHPEITLNTALVNNLQRRGLLSRMTSNIITSYLDHRKPDFVLSVSSANENWGLKNYLDEDLDRL
jgi:hypothetical protein